MNEHRRNLARIRAKLESSGFPRVVMSLLVVLTGGAGFVASYCLLLSGMDAMWLRYLIAMLFAYGVFMGLLYLWLNRQLDELPDLLDPSLPGNPWPGECVVAGQGGGFSGGGSQASFDGAPSSGGSTDVVADLASSPVGTAVDVVAEADEMAIPLALVILAAVLLLSSLFVIYSAPILFAEILLDAALAAGLYHRLRGIGRDHWLETAIRRTIWPFVLTTVCFVVAGWTMAHYVPGANSIGDVLTHLSR